MALTSERKIIGLLGGTFDPVHIGHLAVARHVLGEAGLSEIWFVPAFLPPHKNDHAEGLEITGFHHRLAMLKLATAKTDKFTVSDIEAQRGGPSYSIDTLNILNPLLQDRAETFFIIGIDAFLEIDSWKNYKDLPAVTSFLIISRPGYRNDQAGEIITRYFAGYSCGPEPGTWVSPQSEKKFVLLTMKPVPVSSTEIRERVRKGETVKGFVPPEVEGYIMEHGLYR